MEINDSRCSIELVTDTHLAPISSTSNGEQKAYEIVIPLTISQHLRPAQ